MDRGGGPSGRIDDQASAWQGGKIADQRVVRAIGSEEQQSLDIGIAMFGERPHEIGHIHPTAKPSLAANRRDRKSDHAPLRDRNQCT